MKSFYSVMDDRYDWAQINVDKHGIPYQILIFFIPRSHVVLFEYDVLV